MIRVLHVVESWPPVTSGYTTRSRELVAAQSANPALSPAVVVSSRQSVYGVREVDPLDGVSVDLVPSSAREDRRRQAQPFLVDTRRLRERIAERATALGAELVHAHWSSGIGMASLRAAQRLELPFVAEVRFDLASALTTQTLRGRLPRTERLLRHWFERHLRQADAVIAASTSLERLLRQELSHVAEKLEVVPNGVDAARFAAVGADAGSLRSGGPFVVGTTAKMLRYEGVHHLIDAVALVRERGLKAELLLVGTGPEEPRLRRRAATTGVPARFTGVVDPTEIPRHLATMDVFAVPRLDVAVTRHAGPVKVLEAMAAGRAVVATAVGDLSELLADGRGVLLPSSEPEALATALERLARDDRARAELGTCAARWAARQPSWDDAAQTHLRLYRGVLSRRAKAAS